MLDTPQYWDERVKTYHANDDVDGYVREFLKLANIRPGETVFDMGCGNGALAIPLAEAGHRVLAADFSAGVLRALDDELNARHIHNVFYKLMSWEDDWSEFGMRSGMVDVCLASRSLSATDMEPAFERLNDVARRRVCVSVSVGPSPHSDEVLLREIGVGCRMVNAHLRAQMILAEKGIDAEFSYIESVRRDTFGSKQEAYDRMARMVEREVRDSGEEAFLDAALERLDAWLGENLVPNERAGERVEGGIVEKVLRLMRPRIVRWAFIAWDK